MAKADGAFAFSIKKAWCCRETGCVNFPFPNEKYPIHSKSPFTDLKDVHICMSSKFQLIVSDNDSQTCSVCGIFWWGKDCKDHLQHSNAGLSFGLAELFMFL